MRPTIELTTKFVTIKERLLRRTDKYWWPAHVANPQQPYNCILRRPDWQHKICESVNRVLKHTVDWQSKCLPELVSLVKRLVISQFKELRSVFVLRVTWTNFHLAETHKQYQVTKEVWIDMTEQQRTNLFLRYRNFVQKDRVVISTDRQSSAPVSHHGQIVRNLVNAILFVAKY